MVATQVDAPRKPRVSRIGIAVAAIAVVIGGIAVVRLAFGLGGAFTTAPIETPGTTTVDVAEPGRYFVFEETGSRRQAGIVRFSYNGLPSLGAPDVSVTGPSGEPVATFQAFTSETLERNGTTYSPTVGFQAHEAGVYTVEIAGTTSGSAIVTRSLGDQVRPLGDWFALAFGAGLLGFVAICVIILSAVRAGRANHVPVPVPGGISPPPPPPPHWPPPDRSA